MCKTRVSAIGLVNYWWFRYRISLHLTHEVQAKFISNAIRFSAAAMMRCKVLRAENCA